MQEKIRDLISKMTLEEKAMICSGADSWHTLPIERLGIPTMRMSDGPHGVRKETGETTSPEGGFPTDRSYPSTCYPTASSLACSWDRDLITQLGKALGQDCIAADVSILLGPGMNIKRSPLCGRNFEYFSEDPLLAGEMGAAYINGVQSEGVGTSLKHFATNSQETNRMTTDSVMDERTLREIYLANFETAVKKAQPWTVMSAYNMLAGTYCSENGNLLTDILRREWGFKGIVISDWGAVNEMDDSIAAGLDLEMPAGGEDSKNKIIAAVTSGKLSEQVLDEAAGRLLQIVFKAAQSRKEKKPVDQQKQHEFARQIADECMVLLKNNGVLPLGKGGKLAVAGAFAKEPKIQGGGSSQVTPTAVSIPLDEIRKAAGTNAKVTWSAGYSAGDGGTEPDEALIAQAVAAASEADTAIVFAGLPIESEGWDRDNMCLPKGQLALIDAVAHAAKKAVIVLMNGSPVEMPWVDRADAILESGLCGQAAGEAVADLLFGTVSPSGKLAETYPVKLSDTPAFLNYPGMGGRAEYREGIFVGYRYYDKKQLKPLFPFGYGLSYTTFAYTGIETDRSDFGEDEALTVRVKVRNTGSRAGKETVQLYVRDVQCSVPRPDKELKGFAKVLLQPGEEKTVEFTLSRRAFAFYDEQIHDWRVETGGFEILAGGSSVDTPLKATVTVHSSHEKKAVFTRNSTVGELLADPLGTQIIRQMAGDAFSIDELPAYVLQMPLRSIHMQMPEFNEEQIARLTALLNAER